MVDSPVLATRSSRMVMSPLVQVVGGAIGVLALLVVVLAGLLGSPNPTANPAQIIAWVYFWPGLLVGSALVGDVWELLNPWAALHRVLTRFGSPPPRRLPARLEVWPAIVFFLVFACFELATGLADQPRAVAAAAIVYTAGTLAAMTVFGREAWLSRADPLTVTLRLAARIGPLALAGGPVDGTREVRLRRYGAGLLEPVQPAGWSWTALVMLALGAVLFDALLPTSTWLRLASGADAGVGGALVRGSLAFVVTRTVALVTITAAVALLFSVTMAVVRTLMPRNVPTSTVWTAFAVALVPALVALHAAHNWEYLTVESQRLLPLIADPLGRGWDLLPTRTVRPNRWPGSDSISWYAGVVLVALGFGMALVVSYRAALRLARRPFDAVSALYPLAVLLLVLAVASLAILFQDAFRG